MRMPETVERTDYGELVSEVSGWPYIETEQSNLNQSIVNYRYRCQWVEYLLRTDYTHVTVYTLRSADET